MWKFESKSMLGLLLVGLIGLCLMVAPSNFVATAQGASDKELVVQNWGGAMGEALSKGFYEPFEEETGIKVVQVTSAADMFGKVAAQIRSGKIEWDILEGYDYPTVMQAANKGLLEEIDYSIVTDTQDLAPGSVKKWGLGEDLESVVLAYNINKFPGDKRPKSWADFYDVKKFPGPRTMANWGLPHQVLVTALLADGVPKDELFPIDYERAFKKLDEIKSHVTVWYTSGDQLMDVLIREEVVMGMATDGRAKTAMDLGAPIKIDFNQGLYYVCYWNVVKGAPNRDIAMQFLNFTCRPELHAIFTNYVNYSGASLKSLRFLHPKMVENQCIHPDNFKRLIEVPDENSSEWLTANMADITERFDSWLTK